MSWWVYLKDENGESLTVPAFQDGGTYVMGGSMDAELNITYNYSRFYYQAIDHISGLRYLDGKKASEVIDLLERAVKELGTVHDSDYWKSTEGNAGHALEILLGWARANPQGVFKVS